MRPDSLGPGGHPAPGPLFPGLGFGEDTLTISPAARPVLGAALGPAAVWTLPVFQKVPPQPPEPETPYSQDPQRPFLGEGGLSFPSLADKCFLQSSANL